MPPAEGLNVPSSHLALDGHFVTACGARRGGGYDSLRRARLGAEPVREFTHSTTHPRRLVIYNPESKSGNTNTCVRVDPKGTPEQYHP